MAAVWEFLDALAEFDGNQNAHDDVIKFLQTCGHTVKKSDAWCTETVMAALYKAKAIDLIGGYSDNAGSAKSKAQKKSIWHATTTGAGVLPGDIVIFGENSKANHTEANIGYYVDVSGNYNGGCSRRSYKGRHVMGYIRPKWKTAAMDNLHIAIAAADCMLGVYGSGSTREKQLAVFGADNAKKIQAEVNRIYDDMDKILFDLAVYVIAGHAGKDSYRKKRLGNYYTPVQDKIDAIYSLRGHSVGEAAQLVLDGEFGTNEVRRLLLRFCGYDPDAVQEAVNKALESPSDSVSETGSIVSLFRNADRSTKDVDGLQGDCVILKSGKSALIMDVMRSGALDRIKAEVKGMDTVWLYISHPHSDHMGTNANSLINGGIVSRIHLPMRDTIASEYRSRYDTLVKACQKKGVEIVYLKQGSAIRLAGIKVTVLYQQPNSSTDSVNMRSLCSLVELAGATMLTCGDHHCGKKESKFVYAKHVDIYKSSHHGLYTGDTDSFVKGISPDWILHTGWKSWPLGTIGQDAKTKAAQKAYQKYGNLLPGDVCGRTELLIEDGTITAKGEKNMTGKTISYLLNGKTYNKTVHVCEKATFRKVQSMIPKGGKLL